MPLTSWTVITYGKREPVRQKKCRLDDRKNAELDSDAAAHEDDHKSRIHHHTVALFQMISFSSINQYSKVV